MGDKFVQLHAMQRLIDHNDMHSPTSNVLPIDLLAKQQLNIAEQDALIYHMLLYLQY